MKDAFTPEQEVQLTRLWGKWIVEAMSFPLSPTLEGRIRAIAGDVVHRHQRLLDARRELSDALDRLARAEGHLATAENLFSSAIGEAAPERSRDRSFPAADAARAALAAGKA